MSMKSLIPSRLRSSPRRSRRGAATDSALQADPDHDRTKKHQVAELASATSRVLVPVTVPSNSNKNSLWAKALRCLSEKDKNKEAIFRRILSDTVGAEEIAGILTKEAETKRDLCRSKNWEFEFNGYAVKLKTIADKVVQLLDKIKAVGDVVANVDPIHVGLPWAGIRMLLIAVTSERYMMGTLLIGLEKILYLIDRCKVYELLYPYNPGIEDGYQNFESALLDLYVLILEFLAIAVRTSQENAIAKTFKALWSLDSLSEYDKHFQERMTRVETEAHNCDRLYSKQERLISERQTEALNVILTDLEKLNSVHAEVQRAGDKVSNIWEFLDSRKRHEMLLWISSIPFEDHHRIARQGRTENTGMWLINHGRYQKWKSSEQSMILWLHGIPGAGKTKLVSQVIDSLGHKRHGETFVYFYCNRNEESRRKPEEILCSFIKQLAISDDQKAVHAALVRSYEKRWQTGFSSRTLSLNECEKLLVELVSTYLKVIIILDALDESEESSRKKLLDCFNHLTEHTTNVKIFISSRRDGDIKRQLERKENISIEATDNQDDIAKFVVERIAENENDRYYPISESLKSEIADTLLYKSGGMFQWAALQINELLSLELEQDIRNRLGKLPDDLKSAYDEIYDKIQKNGSRGSEATIATRAFQWVMSAQEPLEADFLVAAVCQDPNSNTIVEPYLDIRFILGACQNLLVMDPVRKRCYFSHLSVQEYFEKHHPLIGQSHAEVAKVCLSLLTDDYSWQEIHDEWENDLVPEPAGGSNGAIWNLAHYSVQYWSAHLKRHDDIRTDERLSCLVREFFGSTVKSSSAYVRWVRTLKNRSIVGYSYNIDAEQLRPHSNSLLGICRLGLSKVLQLFGSNFDPNGVNTSGDSLLVLSILGSDIKLVQILLDMGANINTQPAEGSLYGSALEAASRSENQHLLRILLSAGADVDQQLSCGGYGSALAAAAAQIGPTKNIQILLDAGADVNQQLTCGYYGSALAAAAWECSAERIQILLDAGADVNQQLSCGGYGSALAAAVQTGSTKNIQILLDAGADVNQQLSCGAYGSALAAAAAVAAALGRSTEIQILLDAGADVNQQLSCGEFGSALAAAAAVSAAVAAALGRPTEILQILLDAGADVDQQLTCGKYGNALGAALARWKGDMRVIEMLLDAGTGVNQLLIHGDHGSALAAAFNSGDQEEILRLVAAWPRDKGEYEYF